MLDTTKRNYVARPLPTDIADWVRKTDFNRTNNDRVEDLHLKLVNDPKRSAKYIETLKAVTDTEALEGSLAIDNADAARMLRDAATEAGDHVIARLKLKAIVIHLNVVLKRYGQSRAERRQLIGGEYIASENGQE
jgi:hypothetical protein